MSKAEKRDLPEKSDTRVAVHVVPATLLFFSAVSFSSCGLKHKTALFWSSVKNLIQPQNYAITSTAEILFTVRGYF